jgi:hypothetical protein
VHKCNPSTQEAEARASQVQGQSVLHNMTCLKTKRILKMILVVIISVNDLFYFLLFKKILSVFLSKKILVLN